MSNWVCLGCSNIIRGDNEPLNCQKCGLKAFLREESISKDRYERLKRGESGKDILESIESELTEKINQIKDNKSHELSIIYNKYSRKTLEIENKYSIKENKIKSKDDWLAIICFIGGIVITIWITILIHGIIWKILWFFLGISTIAYILIGVCFTILNKLICRLNHKKNIELNDLSLLQENENKKVDEEAVKRIEDIKKDYGNKIEQAMKEYNDKIDILKDWYRNSKAIDELWDTLVYRFNIILKESYKPAYINNIVIDYYYCVYRDRIVIMDNDYKYKDEITFRYQLFMDLPSEDTCDAVAEVLMNKVKSKILEENNYASVNTKRTWAKCDINCKIPNKNARQFQRI